MQSHENTIKIGLRDPAEALNLFGPHDAFLKQIEANTSAKIIARGEEVTISGSADECSVLGNLFHTLLSLIRKGIQLTERDVVYAHRLAARGQAGELLDRKSVV